MRDEPNPVGPAGRRQVRRAIAACLAAALLLAPAACRDDSAKAAKGRSGIDLAKEKAKEKPKPDFNRLLLRLKLSDRRDALQAVKPGHWTAVTVETCANHFDFAGALALETCSQEQGVRPLDIEGVPFYLTVDPQAILPKGQKKVFDAPLFTPRSLKKPWVRSRLLDESSELEVKRELDELLPMAPHQFQLVVLARLPERYAYLQTLPAVRPPEAIPGSQDPSLYRVIAPVIGAHAGPLTRNPLLWTSVAYIVWDDLAPAVLDEEQRQALLDWLHWGGHLIISGPRSLELLRGSFLASRLPALGTAAIALAPDRLAALDARWAAPRQAVDQQSLAGGAPWTATRLRLQPGGSFLPDTDELVAERRIGRGRILTTAFSLSQPGISKWRGFDGFFNACVLRRPPRKFLAESTAFERIRWADDNEPYATGKRLTHVRFFSRDADEDPQTAKSENEDPSPANPWLANATIPEELEPLGVASWNDFAGVPRAAREILRQGAGIKVPSPRFVLWVVGLYLLVLVPLNWSLFRLLGRVEWAWAAAPLISLGCAALVIWLAQLDIGFSRSATELAILEIEGDYSRAHLTRYTALYASLSTSYNLAYDEPSALALPFASSKEFALLSGESRREVRFHGVGQPRLSGLEVTSNSTSMVHDESFVDVGGGFTWSEPRDDGRWELVNATPVSLSGVSLARRSARSERAMEIAWIGDLAAGGAASPIFRPVADIADPWKGSRRHSSPEGENALSLHSLVKLAEAFHNLDPGETRLVGWLTDDLPTAKIEPAAARRRHGTLVLAHLSRANVAARPDQWEVGAPDPAERLLDEMPEDGPDDRGEPASQPKPLDADGPPPH